jgi:predicted DNA-binding protein YlxM (UPF0122 family)
MRNKKALALTLGFGLAVGSLTMGTATIAQANQRPIGMQNMQIGHQRTIYDQVNHEEMLTLLKIDEQTFKQEADSGESLAQIGSAHHASKQAILDLVVRHMNHQIDKGLRDNRITEAQATEMQTNAVVTAQKMIDRKPMGAMGPMGPMNFDKMHNRPVSPEILTLLQIDEQTFRQERSSGKTLAQIATTHNVSRQAIVDLVVEEMNQYIDQGVVDERITAVQATEMKTNVIDQAQKMVDRQPMGFDKMYNRPVPPEMLILLQIDEQTFRQEQNQGKTLAQIAAAHNVSRQAMVDLVVKEMNQHINQGVVDERITAAQATEMKTNAVDLAQKIVDKNMMEYPTGALE